MQTRGKILTLTGTALLMSVLFFSANVLGKDSGLQAPAEQIVIGGDKPAGFTHATHTALGVACGQCHHNSKHEPLTQEDFAVMENPNPLRCDSCHNAEFADEKLRTRKAVFHARCKECHAKGVDGKLGPKKCTDCHIKE